MSFGTITLEKGRWRIQCEAHVRLKLKRIFPQINQRAEEKLFISDTEENCRDLIWFMLRYPMDVQQRDLMETRAAAHVADEEQVSKLLLAHEPPQVFDLALPARDYQAVAATLVQIKKELLLGDALGLGKTYTSIMPMSRPENLPALVVAYPHLLTQWQIQLALFAPQLRVHILKSTRPYDFGTGEPLDKAATKLRGKRKQASLLPEFSASMPDVIVCNYHKLDGWADTLAGVIKYVVFDEVQELRHDTSKRYAAARMIARKAKLRLGLSATPIFNYGGEFWCVLDVLCPGALGSKDEFSREWCGGGDRIKDTKAFGDHLRREGIYLARTRKDVGRELPPVSQIPYSIPSDASVLDGVRSSAVELARTILKANSSYRGEQFQAHQEFSVMLRQATGIAKAPYVAEFVRMLLENGEKKVILVGWHHIDPVMAYFLLAEDGSDPIIADILGIKREQLEGVRTPNRDLISELQVDPGTIKRLAREYLQRLGEKVQAEEAPEALAA